MRIPLLSAFLPLIAISIVVGVVTIVIFNNMHHDAITTSMRSSLRGSMLFVESAVASPFVQALQDVREVAQNMNITNSSVYRGDGQPLLITNPDSTNLMSLQAHLQDMQVKMSHANGTYAYVYQMYRVPKDANTSVTSTNPEDFHLKWTGIAPDYSYYGVSYNEQWAFSEGYYYPDFTASDAYMYEEVTYFVPEQYLVPANSSGGVMGVPYVYVDPAAPDVPQVLMALLSPYSYADAPPHYITSYATIDVDCLKFLGPFISSLDVPGSRVSIIFPTTGEVMATNLPKLAPGYNLPNASDVSTAVMWVAAQSPDPQLRDAMAEINKLGYALDAIPHQTFIIEPKGSDVVFSVHPVRQDAINLLAVTITERSYYYSDGERASRNAIIICVVLLVVACVAAVVTGVLISRPLTDLGIRMGLTASLQEDPDELHPSTIAEIGSLQDSYTVMKGELTRMKAYLPQSVLQNQDDDDDDDEEHEDTESYSRSRASSSKVSKDDRASNRSSIAKTASSATALGGAARLNLGVTAISKRVTVGHFNLVGFHGCIRQGNYVALNTQTKFIDLVVDTCKDQRGILDAFHGDHISVSWNAVTNVASAPRRAAQAAFDVCMAAKRIAELPSVSVGLATGAALVGNMGTTSMKRFNILGEAYSQALVLERKAAKHISSETRSCVLLNRPMLSDVDLTFYVKIVDVAPILRGAKPSAVVQLVGPKATGVSDEWMYELEAGQSGDHNAKLNGAMLLVADGNTEGISKLFDGLSEAERASVQEVIARLESA